MTHIVLIVENQNSTGNFHYSIKSGRPLVMIYCRTRKSHVARFPLDEWRKDNFRIARNLLDQILPMPILFDIEVDQPPAQAPDESAPAATEPPKETLPKPVKIRRLTNKERAELRKG